MTRRKKYKSKKSPTDQLIEAVRTGRKLTPVQQRLRKLLQGECRTKS